jgi:hypothetical protein
MNPVLARRLAITAGLLLARLAAWVLRDAAPDDGQWTDRAIELLHFAAETWLRQALSLRPPPPGPGYGSDEKQDGEARPSGEEKRRMGWRVVPSRRRRREGEVERFELVRPSPAP